MSQFLYANAFKISANDSEVTIEFNTLFPVLNDDGTMTGTENVGDPVRVIMNKVLAAEFLKGLSGGLSPQPSEKAASANAKMGN